jgi:putative oxidoreductase
MNSLQKPLKLDLYKFSEIEQRIYRKEIIFEWIYSLSELIVRMYIANVFFNSGWAKIQNWSSTIFLFTDEYQVPFLDPVLAAVMATAGELMFPLLLLLGIFSRISALGLFVINAVAVYSYFGVLKDSPVAIHDHLNWALLLLLLMTSKSGYLHLDQIKKIYLKFAGKDQ